MNAADWIHRWARNTPEAEALVEVASGDRATYSALSARVHCHARRLADSHGVKPGDPVAVLCQSRREVFEIAFACMHLMSPFIPLNWRLHAAELEVIVADCAPRLLVHDAAFKQTAQALSAATGCALWDLDSPSPPPLSDAPAPAAPRDPDAPAVVLYTSGTTGTPKGVMLSHKQLFYNALNTLQTCDLVSSDRALAFLPLFHTGGLNCLALPCLYRGAAVVLMERFDPDAAVGVLRDEAITTAIAVPAMYRMLLDSNLPQREGLPALRLLLCGGAPCPPGLLKQYWAMGYALRQGYGLTEVGPNCFTLGPVNDEARLTSVGRPAFHGQVRLMNAEGDVAAPGEVGELQLKGPHVTLGYLNRPEETLKSLVDGWFRTGDLAYADEAGHHYIVGRLKEMFISGGENVYPAEIERVIGEHPAVRDVCVIGVADSRWGEVGLAALELEDGAHLSADEARAFCKGRLAGYKVPKHIDIWPTLPRNATGKVAKPQVKARWQANGGDGPDA